MPKEIFTHSEELFTCYWDLMSKTCKKFSEILSCEVVSAGLVLLATEEQKAGACNSYFCNYNPTEKSCVPLIADTICKTFTDEAKCLPFLTGADRKIAGKCVFANETCTNEVLKFPP
jgi:hypothetical protein